MLTWLEWVILHDDGWSVRTSEINYPSSLARSPAHPSRLRDPLLSPFDEYDFYPLLSVMLIWFAVLGRRIHLIAAADQVGDHV